MKMGPNDAGRVVWAKSEFFYFLFHFFCTNLLYIGSIYAIHVSEGTWKPAVTKTGPNDARYNDYSVFFSVVINVFLPIHVV